MYSNLIEEIIRSHTDKNKFNTGFSFFKRNLVINDYSKVDGDNITFYATVIDENHRNNYTAIISINTKTRVISNMSCDCHSLLSNTKPQICSHIVATVLNGLENLNKETNDEYIDENITITPNITLDISQSRNGYMSMKLDIEGVDSNEYRDIFSSYKNNNRLYRMKNGAYLDLKDNALEQAFKLIDILNIYNDFDNMKIPNNKAIYLEKLIEEEDLSFVNGSKYVSNVVKKFDKVKSKNYEVPKDLNATLRDYQVSGFEFFKTLSDYQFGGILADEMGLGKTIQTIAFLLSNKDKKSIVITPTALIYNWKNELEKFAPTLKVGLLHAAKSEREKILDKIERCSVPAFFSGREEHMRNADKFDGFLKNAQKGEKDSIIVYEVHEDGGVGRNKYIFDGQNMYVLYVGSVWNNDEDVISIDTTYTRIKEWNYTKDGWFTGEFCVPEPPERSETVDGRFRILV